jgi:hypothetical protein
MSNEMRQIVLDAFMAGATFGEGWMTLPDDETTGAANDYVASVISAVPAQSADAERVRSAARGSLDSVDFGKWSYWELTRQPARVRDAIASRVAEQLVTPVAGLSAEERSDLLRLRENENRALAAVGHLDVAITAQVGRTIGLIDRLLTSPPAPDLRSAIAELLDSDAPAGDLRRELARLIGRAQPQTANDKQQDRRDQDDWHDLWDGDARMPRDR